MKVIIWNQITGQNPMITDINTEETIEEIIDGFKSEKVLNANTITLTVRGKQIERHLKIKDAGILEDDTLILQKSVSVAQKDNITVESTSNDSKPTSNDVDTAENIFSKLYKDSPSLPPQSQIPVPVESQPLKIQNNSVKNSDDVFNKLYDNFPDNPPPVLTTPAKTYSHPTRPTPQPPTVPTSQPRWQNNSPPPNPPVYTSPPPQPMPAQQAPPSFSANLSSQQKNPVSAALCSVFVPGLGQVYNGQLEKGIGIYIAELIGWALTFVVGFYFFFLFPILWIYGIYDAYTTANQMNSNQIPVRDSSTSTMVIYTIGVFAVGFILSSIIMSMVWGGALSSITKDSMSKDTSGIQNSNEGLSTTSSNNPLLENDPIIGTWYKWYDWSTDYVKDEGYFVYSDGTFKHQYPFATKYGKWRNLGNKNYRFNEYNPSDQHTSKDGFILSDDESFINSNIRDQFRRFTS